MDILNVIFRCTKLSAEFWTADGLHYWNIVHSPWRAKHGSTGSLLKSVSVDWEECENPKDLQNTRFVASVYRRRPGNPLRPSTTYIASHEHGRRGNRTQMTSSAHYQRPAVVNTPRMLNATWWWPFAHLGFRLIVAEHAMTVGNAPLSPFEASPTLLQLWRLDTVMVVVRCWYQNQCLKYSRLAQVKQDNGATRLVFRINNNVYTLKPRKYTECV